MLSSVFRRTTRPVATVLWNSSFINGGGGSSFLENSSIQKSFFVSLARRRKRPKPGQSKEQAAGTTSNYNGGIELEGFKTSGDNFEEYLKKASLSPWVPVPDSVARKMLELAKAGPSDVHVELGSGDGRVNFQAVDAYTVKRSIGVDVDESLISLANERKAKRHPQPPNLEFRHEDLMNFDEASTTPSIWKTIAEDEDVTVITMYFVQDALNVLRPKLEKALGENRKCRIICCGYSMPEWDAHWVETMLDLHIYVYNYGTPLTDALPKLSEAERAELMADMDAQPFISRDSDDQFPGHNSQFDDVEEIQFPMFDPMEKIDQDLYDFDAEEEEDLDGNPAISKWRKPE